MKRQAVVVSGAGKLSIIDEEMPKLKDTEALVKTETSLISPGTELGEIARRRQKPNETRPLFHTGYCTAGTVTSVGTACKGFQTGDKVVAMGWETAIHATYTNIPVNLLAKIPDGVETQHAVFAALAATSIHAVRRASPKIGETFAVAGQGLIGQFASQFLRISGARVIGLDTIQWRLDVARKLGANYVFNPSEVNLPEKCRQVTFGKGIDGAIVAARGEFTETFSQLVQSLKKAPDGNAVGRIVIVGFVHIDLNLPWGNFEIVSSHRTGPGYHDPAYHHGLDYPTGYVDWTSRRNIEEILHLQEEGLFNVNPLVTHRFPYGKAPEAYEMMLANREPWLGVLLLY